MNKIYEAHMYAYETANKSGFHCFGLIWNSIWLEAVNKKLKRL